MHGSSSVRLWAALGASWLALGGCDSDSHGEDAQRAPKGPAATQFPGAGLGAAGWSLAAGTVTVTCGQPGPGPAGSTGPAPGATATRECYFDADHPDDPAATMEWIVEAAPEGDLLHARLTFNPRFVDNTYGDTAIGWGTAAGPKPMQLPGQPPVPGKPPAHLPKGHTFKDLVGSDHAEFTLTDAAGAVQLKFKADYLTASAPADSGYASLGVTGGDGKMLVGPASAVVAVSTSLDRNLNICGYGDYLVSSPATDANYTANPSAPDWDFRVVYDVWVQRDVFAAAGFGRASVEFVHASPSKAGKSTINVIPRKCPPGWPPYCNNPDGCGGDTPPRTPVCGDEPDEICTDHPPCTGDNCPSKPPEPGFVD
jgi:hypothetical protein